MMLILDGAHRMFVVFLDSFCNIKKNSHPIGGDGRSRRTTFRGESRRLSVHNSVHKQNVSGWLKMINIIIIIIIIINIFNVA